MVALGIVAFVVALLLSVVLHEAGHFVTARRFGMKATQFFVGFGPTLWSRRRGETEYGIKAVPAGGFVKIVGMTPLEDVDPEDEPRAFYKQSAGKKAVVLAAGSFVHFLIAIGLVVATVVGFGTVDQEAPVVTAPSESLPASVEIVGGQVVASEDTVPAPAAGVLQREDRVLAVDGEPTATWQEVVAAVRAKPGEQVQLQVERNGQVLDVALVPAAVTRPAIDGEGVQQPGTTETVGAIGVGQTVVFSRPSGPGEAISETGDTLGLMIEGTYRAVTEKLGTVTSLYSPERDREGLVGLVGAARVSGEVLNIEQIPFAQRAASFLLLIAGLNLFVGLFNLLPLLPLDGGHLAVLGFETARDKVRRLFGYRGELQRVDFTKLLPLTYAVVLAFVGLTVWIMGADIVNPIRLNQ
ncbi:MAG TPA: site-2 protease family protein [Mycobacteriales bacterium]|nr:site-2 protease family protein [Mycobacteriales bacterium]